MPKVFHNFLPILWSILFVQDWINVSKTCESQVLIFLYVFNKRVPYFDKKVVVKCHVFFYDSLIMIENNSLKNVIAYVHHCYQLSEYFRQQIKYFRVPVSLENPLKSFKTFKNKSFSHRHFCFDYIIIECSRIISNRPDQSKDDYWVVSFLQLFEMCNKDSINYFFQIIPLIDINWK